MDSTAAVVIVFSGSQDGALGGRSAVRMLTLVGGRKGLKRVE